MAKKITVEEKVRRLEEQLRALTRKSVTGRPTLFDEKQIGILERACSLAGMKEERVAWLLGVSKSTIEKYIKRKYGVSFSEFRDQKSSKTDFLMLNKQVELALKGDTKMLQSYLDEYCGQGRSKTLNIGNSSEQPFQLVINAPKEN